MKIDLTNIVDINLPIELNSNTVTGVIGNLNTFLSQEETVTANLNFSNTNFAYPGGLTPLLAYLKDRVENNKKYHIILNSKNSPIDSYIRRMGFYKILGLSDNFSMAKWSGVGRFQEPYYFSKETDANEVTEKSSNIIKTFTTDRNVQNYNEAIGWCISEIIDNALCHSDANVSVTMSQKYKNMGITEFCVADRGIGIKNSMGIGSIKEALEKCVTREKGINSKGRGNGLFYTTELIKRDTSGKCLMTIWSEDHMLILYSGMEQPQIKQVESYWQGVNISISMYNGISSSIKDLMKTIDNYDYSFSYEEQTEYYENLFEN